MSRPLQDKDDQWRGERPNGAVPIFDPGMSPLGTDDEAGGAPSTVRTPDPDSWRREPLPTSPDRNGAGLRLTPRVWYAAAVAVVILLAAAGWLSLQAG
ncbi:MAG TPA: hypothetical protein VF686_06780 [Brevundimonas sp.]